MHFGMKTNPPKDPSDKRQTFLTPKGPLDSN